MKNLIFITVFLHLTSEDRDFNLSYEDYDRFDEYSNSRSSSPSSNDYKMEPEPSTPAPTTTISSTTVSESADTTTGQLAVKKRRKCMKICLEQCDNPEKGNIRELLAFKNIFFVRLCQRNCSKTINLCVLETSDEGFIDISPMKKDIIFVIIIGILLILLLFAFARLMCCKYIRLRQYHVEQDQMRRRDSRTCETSFTNAGAALTSGSVQGTSPIMEPIIDQPSTSQSSIFNREWMEASRNRGKLFKFLLFCKSL